MSDSNQSDAETLFRASEIFEELGDKRTAFKCVSIGAKLGHPLCQLQVGNMYVSGAGTKKDFRLAAYWYRKAYRNGYATGAFNLALHNMQQGERRSAITWFRKAVEHNHGEAFVELAKLYKELGATKRRAVSLLQRALRLTRYDITDDAREEAETLLGELTRSKGQEIEKRD